MLYLLRLKDGSIDSVSKGTLIEADGSTHNLKLEDFKVDVLDRWRSPHNNADYPMRWRLSIPSAGISIELTPRIKDQEMADISTVYWEGAVTLAGTSKYFISAEAPPISESFLKKSFSAGVDK